ncbi:hypothetical protein [Ensifer adhaerens]|uniref:hypothetical protein n=1 Tax=Ensifer adhaerens TaxID=106592 RepID=UPI001F3D22C7|nr:hypothetical protein [Ensifer adhaerens]
MSSVKYMRFPGIPDKAGDRFAPDSAADRGIASRPQWRTGKTEHNQRQMDPGEIPAFVVDVLEAGCDICAVGHDSYVISEIVEQTATKEKLDRIIEKYGNRDALRWEIVGYLWSIGRFLELTSEITRH